MSAWWPVDVVNISGAWANSPGFYYPQLGHNGIDLACAVGTPVYAIEDGTVEFEGWGQNHSWMGAIAGICAIIRHGFGYSGYAHLSQTIVAKGQWVAKGQRIGSSGNTGGSTGPHLHVETLPPNPNFQNGFAGRVNPATIAPMVPRGSSGAIGPKQRKVGANPAKRRVDATTKSNEVQPPLAANQVGDFQGWKRGEQVNDGVANTNIWFQGDPSGNWFWAGAFTSQATTNLADRNPVAPSIGANQRQVDAGVPVRVRSKPSTAGTVTAELAAGTIVTLEGYVVGEKVAGITLWYKVDKGYAWAGGFTKEDASGLKDLTTPVDPGPVDPGPVDNYPTFTKFSPVVTRVEPAHKENYQVGNFPLSQDNVVLHDFGTDGKDSFSGTLSWFKNVTSETSSHFVVSGDEIVQMVSLNNRAWHAGPNGNGFIGVEIDPAAGRAKGDPLRDKTVASVNRLLAALELHYKNKLAHRKHPEFMVTSCGDDIHLEDYVTVTVPDPKPEVPDTGELQESVNGLTKVINALMDLLKKIFRIN